MLSSISWPQYLAAVLILTIAYYLYVGLRYYQAEVAKAFSHRQHPSVIPPVQSASYSVMGAAKPDPGISYIDSAEISFAEVIPDQAELTEPDEPRGTSKTDKGPESELIWEINNLITAFRDIDNKPEFLSLLQILLDSFQRYNHEIPLSAVYEEVLETANSCLPFHLIYADLQNK